MGSLLAVLLLCGLPVVESASSPVEIAQQALLDSHNALRVKAGSKPLVLDEALTKRAQAWAEEMTRSGFRHSGGNVGENIAEGFDKVSDVMKAWKNSSGHYANIISRSYIKVGFGFAFKKGQWYYCTDFR